MSECQTCIVRVMAYVISVCGMKGGVGKSTIAVTVGVAFHRAGQNTLLVDADEQGTLRSWAGRGAEDRLDVPPVVAMDARNLARDLTRVAKDHDAVVIDTPARLGREARAAMVLSDLVLLPVARGLPGLAALDETLKIVEDARAMRPDLDVRVVLNRVDRTTLSKVTRERLVEMGLAILGDGLRDLVAFDEAMSCGADVVGYAPESEAAAEAKQLFSDIKKIIGRRTK
jgi:chromosome partitioning protein